MSDLHPNMFVSVEGRSEKWWLLEVDLERSLGRVTSEDRDAGISFDLPLNRIAAWAGGPATAQAKVKKATRMTDHVKKARRVRAAGRGR